MTRRLIVNADDFGQSAGINEGIIRCYEDGILTSASLMVSWPDAAAAASYAGAHLRLSVGLHLDFGEWTYENQEWIERYSVVRLDDAAAVEAEVARQLAVFRRLMARDPTHFDSHQHVHRAAPLDRIVDAYGRRLGVPVRQRTRAVNYVGSFYGHGTNGESLPAAIGVDALIAIVRTLPAGTSELGCHPGLRDDVPSMYLAERTREVEALCDVRVRAAIDQEGIELISFHDAGALVEKREECV